MNAPLPFTADAGESEELARAELYGLLTRLWLAAPDADLLQRFGHAVTETPQPGGFLEPPWMALVHTMRTIGPAEAAAQYDALFGGVGKPEVFLYASFYLTGFLNERPLALLRQDLQRLGLARDDTRAETEDHVAYLFEVMRYLIAGDDLAVCNLEQQRRFFRKHLQTWVEALCTAVEQHPQAGAWQAVAAFTRAFIEVEIQGFDLLDT